MVSKVLYLLESFMFLSINHIIQLVCFALLLSCGQMLFKYTAETTPQLSSVSGLFALFLNVWFWLSLVLYGSATLLWIYILQQIPLSMAYPFVALGFVVVPIASWALFNEQINIFYLAGVAFIICGLVIITTMAQK